MSSTLDNSFILVEPGDSDWELLNEAEPAPMLAAKPNPNVAPLVATEGGDGDILGRSEDCGRRFACLLMSDWSYSKTPLNPGTLLKGAFKVDVDTSKGGSHCHWGPSHIARCGVYGDFTMTGLAVLRDNQCVDDECFMVAATVTRALDGQRVDYGRIVAFRGTKPASEMKTWPHVAAGVSHSLIDERARLARDTETGVATVTGHSLGGTCATAFLELVYSNSPTTGIIVFNPGAGAHTGLNQPWQESAVKAMRRAGTACEIHYCVNDPINSATNLKSFVWADRSRATYFRTYVHNTPKSLKDVLGNHGLGSFLEPEQAIRTIPFQMSGPFTDIAMM